MTDNLELEKPLWSAADKLRNNMMLRSTSTWYSDLFSLNIFLTLLMNSIKSWKRKKNKQVQTRRTKMNTQRKEFFMCLLRHGGRGSKKELNFQQ